MKGFDELIQMQPLVILWNRNIGNILLDALRFSIRIRAQRIAAVFANLIESLRVEFLNFKTFNMSLDLLPSCYLFVHIDYALF